MKKIIKILSLFLLIITMTGCAKSNLTMHITEEDVNLSLIYGLKHELVDKEDYFKDLKEELEEIGYKTFDYKDSNYTGIKATISLGELDSLTTDKNIEVNLGDLFEKESNKSEIFKLEDEIYYANFLIDLDDQAINDKFSLAEVKKEELDLKFELNLPMKTKSNNANTISEDGRTLIWNLNYGEKNEINFSFKLNDNAFLYSIIASGILLTVFIIVVVFKINTINKVDTEDRLEHSVTKTTDEDIKPYGTEEILQDEIKKEDSIDELGIIKKSSSNVFSDLMNQPKEEKKTEVKKTVPKVEVNHSEQYSKDDPVFGFLYDEDKNKE